MINPAKSGVDEHFFASLLQGQRQAQKQLYDQHSSKMFALCLRYTGSQEEAEDLLQEGFIKVFNNLVQYKGEGSFEGWIRRIFVNSAVEFLRKRNLKPRMVDHLNVDVEIEHSSGFDKLSLSDLLQMIQKLPPGYRTIFNLYVIEGYSHKEISQLLHISEGTSKSQLARAKMILQKYFSKRGIVV
jgi:RNA polymerase sigma factor (sigma-70 family)